MIEMYLRSGRILAPTIFQSSKKSTQESKSMETKTAGHSKGVKSKKAIPKNILFETRNPQTKWEDGLALASKDTNHLQNKDTLIIPNKIKTIQIQFDYPLQYPFIQTFDKPKEGWTRDGTLDGFHFF